MTYISKKEKVFDLPEQDDSSSVTLKPSENRLKRFPSVSDRRAWTSEEFQRYQHFYGLVNGSETSISKCSSFKYIPFDVLLAILMAEKDAYIQELLDKQDDSKSSCGGKLYKAEGFEDSDDDRDALIRKDAEVVALKNKIAGLKSELEDYRETLTKAMHKLESMDVILSENSLLKEKLKCSEETIKFLEEKKAALERELEYYKTFDGVEKRYCTDSQHSWDSGDYREIDRLSSERDILQLQVEKLQNELERAKLAQEEVEVLRKISETNSSSLEEISKENECYKKKLETMKCLEKHIEELKSQAHTLTEKYKRESQKANDQQKQINMRTKELEALREERNKLEKRVNELVTYENQYLSLQAKLRQVELIIDENEFLNNKLTQLDRLEVENEQLKLKIQKLKTAEIQVAEDKETIVQLQNAVVDQENEIKKMVKQIEELSQGYNDKTVIRDLQNELEEKNGILRKYEKQLAEIPFLESEIDELKNKLQKCIDDFKVDKDLLKKLQEEFEACQRRCHELEELSSFCPAAADISNTETKPSTKTADSCHTNKILTVDKGENTIAKVKQDVESQSTPQCKEQSIEALTIDIGVHKLKELEEQNQILKNEVEVLHLKLAGIDMDALIKQTRELKELLNAKDKKIQELENEVEMFKKKLSDYGNVPKLKEDLTHLEEKIEHLKTTNRHLEEEKINLQKEVDVQTRELEESLSKEKKAREFAIDLAKEMEKKFQYEMDKAKAVETMSKLQKEEANMAKQEMYTRFCADMDSIKHCIHLSKTLIKELKVENQTLRELKEYAEHIEKKALTNLIRKLRTEVKVLKSLSKPELQKVCDTLQKKVKKLMNETDTLLEEIKGLKTALESEKEAKDYLEKELLSLQAELAACVTAGSEAFGKEMAVKDALIISLQKEVSNAKLESENSMKDAQTLREENVKLVNNYNNLKSQQKDSENNINWLLSKVEELNLTIKGMEEKAKEQAEAIDSYKKTVEEYKKDILTSKEKIENLQKKISEQEELINHYKNTIKTFENAKVEKAEVSVGTEEIDKNLESTPKSKEDEIEKLSKLSSDTQNQLIKVKSEMKELKCRLAENEPALNGDQSFEKNFQEKCVLEEALKNMENEIEKLKAKIEECKEVEKEMVALKDKKESLLMKMTEFEAEISDLKAKLCDFESLKKELEQLKEEKSRLKQKPDVDDLVLQLQQKNKEADSLKEMNDNLKEELEKAENLLVVSQKLQKTLPQNSGLEFFTPPALPSPRGASSEEAVLETIPLDLHKKEITELENRYLAQIEEIKKTNAEKLKKLMEECEKEAKCRSKSFHDSINSIKSSYENDIRKLVEKHKISIMRLQNLHEDEVQELNVNYETQMEAMQTQNENLINDLRTESIKKIRHLTEKHEKQVQELKTNYEELLKEKEAMLLVEKSSVEMNLSHSTNDLKEVHKQAVDNLSHFYQSNMTELEEKHNKELKKCKKNNMKRIELMKNKYEALLLEERKKYEEQLEELLLQLKQGQRGDTAESGIDSFVTKKSSISNPRLEFHEVLQKIINEGLEALSFEELILVHSKTCFMPVAMGDNGDASGDLGGNCQHKVLMTAEKEELLKRIFVLEHEMVIKQLETHEAIVNMETAEKCRIQELENALVTAQQKNAELKRLIANQSKLQTDLKIERYMLDRETALNEANVLEKVKELERERAEKRKLEEELQKEKTNVKHMMASLEAEKERIRSQRKWDSEYVESMRRRLEDALSHEHKMESQLDYEVRFRAKLETELQALQKSFNLIAEQPSAQIPVDFKTVNDIKNFDESENNDEEFPLRRKNRHRGKSKASLNI